MVLAVVPAMPSIFELICVDDNCARRMQVIFVIAVDAASCERVYDFNAETPESALPSCPIRLAPDLSPA